MAPNTIASFIAWDDRGSEHEVLILDNGTMCINDQCIGHGYEVIRIGPGQFELIIDEEEMLGLPNIRLTSDDPLAMGA